MRTVVVTGASSGLGAAAVVELARRDWQVAVVGRDAERTAAVAARAGGIPFIADFDDLDQVRALADDLLARFPRIDALVNNAGGIVSRRSTTVDGNETTLQRNVLAAALLTELLAPRLSAARDTGRIVLTSSVLNRLGGLRLDDLDFVDRRYGAGWRAYGASKLATILYARSLVARTGLEAYAFHPGYVRSGFGAESRTARLLQLVTGSMQISPEAGAAPLVHLVDTPELGVPNGTYFDGLDPLGATHPSAGDARLADELWQAIARRIDVPAAVER
ncbi:MAG: SDR family NAD(P)-dependent oxidoreductase [Microcella sp.]|uniref:SDR family NAD(P)-dependent oxidoreductase n=1 Tax=Microcella sp. TaxID=1913979 RepID=UPI0027195478|nr:SDR family NAD(P)-dependent oxidoreductase [Microcella sp.]MDO8337837.1 SDR family NAD(P)-dependent oxidoreductase [Microcella sp.]